jgi:hypothetical protein
MCTLPQPTANGLAQAVAAFVLSASLIPRLSDSLSTSTTELLSTTAGPGELDSARAERDQHRVGFLRVQFPGRVGDLAHTVQQSLKPGRAGPVRHQQFQPR